MIKAVFRRSSFFRLCWIVKVGKKEKFSIMIIGCNLNIDTDDEFTGVHSKRIGKFTKL